MTEDGKDIEVDASNVEAHKGDSSQDPGLTERTNSQLAELNLSHRKWIVGGACLLCVIMFVQFFYLVGVHVAKPSFSPYILIPVSLMGLIPTAILICILRGLYQAKNKDSVENVIPIKIVADIVKIVTE